MNYNFKLNNINVKLIFVPLIAFILGFVSINILNSNKVDANNINTEHTKEWWSSRINQAKTQLHNINDQAIIGKTANKYNIFIKKTSSGVVLSLPNINHPDSIGCFETIKWGLVTLGAAIIVAAAAGEINAIVIAGIALSADLITKAAQLISNGISIIVVADQIAHKICD